MRMLVATILFALCPLCVLADYNQTTVMATRVSVGVGSNNVGGANYYGGINVMTLQRQGPTWVEGSAFYTTNMIVNPQMPREGALASYGMYAGLAGYKWDGLGARMGQISIASASFNSPPTQINTSTIIPNAEGYSTGITGVVWDKYGTSYWAAGTSGTRSGTFGQNGGTVQTSPAPLNTIGIHIPANQGHLYVSTETGIHSVGGTVPFGTGHVTTPFVLTGAGSMPGGFSISPDQLTVYVADSRSNGLGGIQKWVRNDYESEFNLITTFSIGTGIGALNVAVDYNYQGLPDFTAAIYVVTAEENNNRILTFNDINNLPVDMFTISNSGFGDIYRGIAVHEIVSPVPEPGLVFVAGCAIFFFAARSRREVR